ncbi:MAG: alpha/beta fold hydrolase [Phycisphaerales bacterium JB060]
MRGFEHWARPERHVRWRWVLGVYLALLVASHVVYAAWPKALMVMPEPKPTGVVGIDSRDVAYTAYSSGRADAPFVLLIHGSPGDATNFDRLGPELAGRGVDSIAVDLPGFGASQTRPDASARCMAAVCGRLLQHLHERGEAPGRVHVLGWSNGGAVVLNMTDLPEAWQVEIASITMMMATGAQRTEGSGNYLFEKAKYALGYVGVFAAVELVPHFGLLGPRGFWYSFMANFMETDQRPLADTLRTLDEPLLILQAQQDFLVAPWAAEVHHELASRSTLVRLDGGHILPFTQPGPLADHIAAFVHRHEDPAVEPVRATVDLAVKPEHGAVTRALDAAATWLRSRHWTLEALVVMLLALAWWRMGLVIAAALVAGMYVDYGVASVGLAVAVLVRGPGVWRRALCLLVGIVALLPAWLLVRFGGWWAVERWGVTALFVVLLLAAPLTWVLPRVWTRMGRQRIRAQVWRWISHEFWPSWISYLLLTPTFVTQSLRARHPVAFTATNPGIAGAGGFVGERKSTIAAALERSGAPLLPTVLIRMHSDPERRVRRVERLLQTRPELGGYPVVLKPDRGERGRAVRVCRSVEDVREQVARVPTDLVLQKFDASPYEVGLFWVRLHKPGRGDEAGREGEIFAVTRKVFPVIVGDGRRTLRQLVLADDRFRVQERVFEARFGRAIDRVPSTGERVRMGMAGNHSQGCRFEDGADLITDALTHVIDGICRRFPDADGRPGGLDIGRFDIRYADEDELKAGRGFSVIELNGSSAEATNVYDPTRTWWWAIEVMSQQWAHAYRLGTMRRAMGYPAVSLADLMRMVWRARRSRPGSELAD